MEGLAEVIGVFVDLFIGVFFDGSFLDVVAVLVFIWGDYDLSWIGGRVPMPTLSPNLFLHRL